MIYHVKPVAATLTNLVTAAPGKECFLTGWICNTSATADDYVTVYALGAQETDVTGKELYSSLRIPMQDTFSFTPVHLDAGESLVVKSANGSCVFTVTGQEVTK